jgi:hypothetical protein
MIPLPTHGLFKNLTGMSFGRLRVRAYAGRIGGVHAFVCDCECGGEVTTKGTLVARGETKSCGCLLGDRNRERLAVHMMSQSAEWRIWAGMKKRCLNPKVKAFERYGGRGIRVCNRWASSFENFLADMGPRPSKQHSVERDDVDGDYEPSNCRWATRPEQARNTRLTMRLEHRGRTLSVWEWERETGVSAIQIQKRIGRGWSVDRALTQPQRRSPA